MAVRCHVSGGRRRDTTEMKEVRRSINLQRHKIAGKFPEPMFYSGGLNVCKFVR